MKPLRARVTVRIRGAGVGEIRGDVPVVHPPAIDAVEVLADVAPASEAAGPIWSLPAG